MRNLLSISVYLIVFYQVLSAPAVTDSKSDDVEQELIRHHHATRTDTAESSEDEHAYSADDMPSADDSSPIESVEEERDSKTDDVDEAHYNKEDLYDITVGDVIRDVLLTLRDHPEIVKELIESEKEKLVGRIGSVNTALDLDSMGDHLSNFEQPPEQLNHEPKSVEKKAGRSGMPVNPGHYDKMEDKRMDEIIDDNYDNHDVSEESREFHEFMKWPQEGGKENSMDDFDKETSGSSDKMDDFKQLDKQQTTNTDSLNEAETDSRDTGESNEEADKRSPFRLPFLYNRRQSFDNKESTEERAHTKMESMESQARENDASSSAQTNISKEAHAQDEESEADMDETHLNTSHKDKSEDELSWLLQKVRASHDNEESNKRQTM